MKILVVEDDPFVREMAVAGLEDAGFEAIEAASGGDALRLLQAGIVLDVLLTDIRLAEANGWAVARAYRERFPDLPVLYVTGYAEQVQPVPGSSSRSPTGWLRWLASWEHGRPERQSPLEQGADHPALTAIVLERRSIHASLFL
jgi:CheY-like chemotaxis protein